MHLYQLLQEPYCIQRFCNIFDKRTLCEVDKKCNEIVSKSLKQCITKDERSELIIKEITISPMFKIIEEDLENNHGRKLKEHILEYVNKNKSKWYSIPAGYNSPTTLINLLNVQICILVHTT